MAGYKLDDPRLWESVARQAEETAAAWPVDERMLARLEPLLAAPPAGRPDRAVPPLPEKQAA